MSYTTLAKTSRQTKTRDDLAGGSLVLLSAAAAVICTLPLPAGSVSGDTITWSGFAAATPAVFGTAIASAQLRTAAAAPYRNITSVGLAGSGAQLQLSKLTPASGEQVTVLGSLTLQHAA